MEPVKIEKGQVVENEALQADKSIVEERTAQTEKEQEIRVPVTPETQLELEILQYEKQACEAELVAAQAKLAKINKMIDYKTQKILSAYQAQQQAIVAQQRAREESNAAGVVLTK